MRLPAVPSKHMVDHLNATYFHQIWNAPHDRGRVNLGLRKSTIRVSTGAVAIGLSVVGLPTTDSAYAIYQTGSRAFEQILDFPTDSWVKAQDFLHSEDMFVLAYGTSGRTFPSSQIYLRYLPTINQMLVACSITYTKKCLGELYPDLYLTLYQDTIRATPIIESLYTVGTMLSSATPPANVAAAIAAAKLQSPYGTLVIVNGWVYDAANIPTLVNGDIVQVLADPDIIGYVDTTVDDNETGYYSDLYQEYRELIHIPKALNPNNVILTTDALTALVFDPVTRKGVLGHRVHPHAIESVTHNDFSMSRTALSGFSQSLDALSVKVRVYVRLPIESNRLTDDVNHLRDLYALNDTKIVQQLLGLASPQIGEWKAQLLEASSFLALLYKFDRQSIDQALSVYIAAMGYYDVASVLGQQMRYYTYKGAEVAIIKPARLFGYPCQALVYADGLKVPEGSYTVTNDKSQSFLLGFKPGSQVVEGSRIAVYILEEGYRTPVPFTPSEEDPALILDSGDYSVYIQKDYDTPQPVWKNSVGSGFKLIPPGTADYVVTTNSDGSSTFTFRMKHFGSSFYLIPKYGMVTAVYDLTDTVTQKSPIVIGLTTTDNFGDILPILGYQSMEVYLNRHRLIEGLDYEIQPIEDADGYTLQNLLAVANGDYLDLEGGINQLEVCVHGDKIVSEDKGYAIEGHLYRADLPIIFSKSSTRTFVRGILKEEVSEIGNVATVAGDLDNGAPFLMQHMVAFGVGKLLANFSPNQDINLRSRIEHVLGIELPTFPETMIVDHLHALFSPFLAQIVSDVGNGVITITDEPRDEAFLRQFKGYDTLLDRDPLVGPRNDLIDRRFVTLAAHYDNYAVDDPTQMMLIQRLTTMSLTPSELSIKEVLL